MPWSKEAEQAQLLEHEKARADQNQKQAEFWKTSYERWRQFGVRTYLLTSSVPPGTSVEALEQMKKVIEKLRDDYQQTMKADSDELDALKKERGE